MLTAHNWDKIEPEVMMEGVKRRVIHTERSTVCRFELATGAVVPRHQHDNEQVTHVISGTLKFEFEGGGLEASAGDVVEIPSNAWHQVTVLEDSIAMDVFTPRREDWIRGDDAYLRNPSG